MAKVQFAGIIQGVRGTLGGVVFTAGKSGPFIRPWARGANPQAFDQQYQRALLPIAAEAWRALSSGERDNWNTWAAEPEQELTDVFGQPYYISGWQWFLKTSIYLTRAYRDLPTSPPASARPAAPTLISVDVYQDDGSPPVLTWPTDEFDGYDLIVHASVVSSEIRLTQSTAAYFEWFSMQQPVDPDSETLPDLVDIVGDTLEGQTVFVRAFRQTDDGQRSAPGVISGVIQAWP